MTPHWTHKAQQKAQAAEGFYTFMHTVYCVEKRWVIPSFNIQYRGNILYFLIYCLIFRQYCTICIILYVKFRSLQQVSKQRRYYTSTQRRNTNSKKAIYLKSMYFILSIVHIFTNVSLKPYWYKSYSTLFGVLQCTFLNIKPKCVSMSLLKRTVWSLFNKSLKARYFKVYLK